MSNWYSASIFLQAIHQDSVNAEGLWEEQVLLIQANDEEEARVLAAELGKGKEHEYVADEPTRHLVRWRFVAVERVCEIESNALANGVELFSRFLKAEEAERLLKGFDN